MIDFASFMILAIPYSIIGIVASTIAKNENFPKAIRAFALILWPLALIILVVKIFIDQLRYIFSD